MRTRLTIGAILAIVLPFVAVSADLSTLMTPDDVMLRKPSKPRRSGGGNPLFATSAANEQAAREKAAAEQAAREKAAAEQAAREKAAVEQAAREKAAAEQAAREKAAAEQAAREKAAAEKAARDLADVERVAAEERTVRERAAKLESERLSMESKAKAALDAAAQAEIQKRAAEEAAAKATSEKREAEMAMARAASERQAAEAAAAEAAAAKKAAEDAAAKAEAEKALADEKAAAELKALREQIAAERAAREKAEADRLAAVQQAEAKMAEAKTVKTEAEAAINEVVQKVRDEKAARERAEAAVVAAEARAEAEKKAAEKAVEAQAAAEKRVNYLMNPDPDERPRPKKLVAEGDSKDVTETMPGEKAKKADKVDKKAAKKPLTGREAVITAERTDYDRKEGVILFDRNVYVDDEQYQMHADRLFVFLDGTNDLKRLVAIGHVAITNEEKTASCARAVYTKAVSKIVMYGDDTAKARLHEAAKKGDNDAQGDRITFWLNSEQVEIEGPVISMPGGALKGASGKSLLQQVK